MITHGELAEVCRRWYALNRDARLRHAAEALDRAGESAAILRGTVRGLEAADPLCSALPSLRVALETLERAG